MRKEINFDFKNRDERVKFIDYLILIVIVERLLLD